MDQVAPGVYVHEYPSGNVGFVETGAGIICIDCPMMPSDIRDWKHKIASVSREPIVHLIQTDYDQVRVVGALYFDATLVAHDSTWDRLKIYGSEKTLNQINTLIENDGGVGGWYARPPDITFSQQLLLHRGDREIHVLHGGGHSCATSMVYLPQSELVFSGDLVFCNQHPSMSYAETKEWVATLERLSQMPLKTIVPGHGPVCTHAAARPLAAYLKRMRQQVKKSFDSGKSKSETSAAMIAEMLDAFPYTEQERDERRQRIKSGSDRIYDECRALAKAKAQHSGSRSTSRSARRGSRAAKRSRSTRSRKRG
jgi:glyoxylase-like metal-dependent hydrolase (beta-lactamase superfamily II)